MIHELKTWPGPFEACWIRRKFAEFRLNDRKFREGDTLVLREWNPEEERYLGREITAIVTDARYGPSFGIPSGFAMLSFIETGRRTYDTGIGGVP